MSTTHPARLGAGFALAAAFALPFVITTTSGEKNPPTPTILAAATPMPVSNDFREDRLLPGNGSIDDGSNGCGLKKGVDVCALDFIQTHMPHYIR